MVECPCVWWILNLPAFKSQKDVIMDLSSETPGIGWGIYLFGLPEA